MPVHGGGLRLADLSFLVYDRAVHPDWFGARAWRAVRQGPWECVARLVPGGHVLSWAAGPVRATEVLTRLDEAPPEAGLRFRSNVRGERATQVGLGPRGSYSCCFEAERVDAEVFHHLSEELALDARDGLFLATPSAGRLEPPALGLVRFEPLENGLSVHATHTLPAERAIVRVQTLFEVLPG
jgi:hypothetical protein